MDSIAQKNDEDYRNLVERINDVIYTVDVNGVFTYISPVVSRQAGYAPEEVMGKHFSHFIHCEDLPRLQQAFLNSLAGEFKSVDFRVLTASGDHTWVRSSARAIRKGETVLGLRGSYTDINEQKVIEKQLQQAKKFEAIGTLAGGIAHEFNNLFAIILGNAELAMDAVRQFRPVWQNLEEIKTATLRAGDIVRQLMNLGHCVEISKEPLKIVPAIKNYLQLIRISFPEFVDIGITAEDDSLTVVADKTQLNQALLNLCSNAAHAMAENGGILTISLNTKVISNKNSNRYQRIKPGDYIQIKFADTGHGIDPAVIDKIFDPYFSTKETNEGSGMGLAVVHGIVKAHEGVIWVESRINKGTSFYILLPKAPIPHRTHKQRHHKSDANQRSCDKKKHHRPKGPQKAFKDQNV